jgi:hypothetical protein
LFLFSVCGITQSTQPLPPQTTNGPCSPIFNGSNNTNNCTPQPRTLTKDQISKLSTAIAQIPQGIQVKIGAADSGEAYDYADQIRKALGIERKVGTFISGHFKGILITVTSFSDVATAPAQQLGFALQQAGIPVVAVQEDSVHDHPTEIGIFIGEQ